jgi:tungstate transport system ATP-binding protein
VVKADGLAAGKGVVVAATEDEAIAAIDAFMDRRIHGEAGAAVVLVTQDQAGALTFCDRLAVIIGGRLLQQGEPQEIFSRPVSAEVADFVGMETILPGKVASKRDNLCAVEAMGETLMVVSDCEPGDSVFVCVRPEVVSVSLGPDAGGRRNNFRAKVAAVAPWGLEYKIELRCGFTLQASVTKQLVDGLAVKAGSEVYASFKATAVHLIKRMI